MELCDLAPMAKRPSTMDALRQLAESLPEYECTPTTGMAYGEQVKYVSWTFDPAKFDTLEVLHVTDIQYGHVECRIHRVIEYRDWILKQPKRFVLFGGDLVAASTGLSPGSPG